MADQAYKMPKMKPWVSPAFHENQINVTKALRELKRSANDFESFLATFYATSSVSLIGTQRAINNAFAAWDAELKVMLQNVVDMD